ncbi:MAG: hypothetical protein JO249_22205 [Acidobacteria bacterium]|nr:hypothetical protein [Acidobacteriota bacterium]
MSNVIKRVRLWKEIGPYYSGQGYDGKSGESRGTESVLNALILSNHDSEYGHLSEVTRLAFNNMWGQQQTSGASTGAWRWLQFDLQPWEANDSEFYGAALASVAVGTAPDKYRSNASIQHNLVLLRTYLKREYMKQSLIHKVVLLWASTRDPGLLSAEQQRAIISEVLHEQRPDGGWKLSALAYRKQPLFSFVSTWIREDGTPMERGSDGFATAMIVYALEQSGMSSANIHVQQALSWLLQNQNKNAGFWPSYSLNKRRNASSTTGHFMSDAATAYAVLALCADARGTHVAHWTARP